MPSPLGVSMPQSIAKLSGRALSPHISRDIQAFSAALEQACRKKRKDSEIPILKLSTNVFLIPDDFGG
jgi:hypothetical protein